jgi:hypothetical protein
LQSAGKWIDRRKLLLSDRRKMSWSKGKHSDGLVCPPIVIPNFVLLMVVAFALLRREPAFFDEIGSC